MRAIGTGTVVRGGPMRTTRPPADSRRTICSPWRCWS